MMPRGSPYRVGFAALALLVACGGGLKLKVMNSSARKPSNVAVYFTVDTGDGKPVPGLTADKFTIYEDGSKVSEFESKQTILNPKVAASHYTLLLVDMSGSVSESGHVDDVVDAGNKFTEKVEKFQKVGVYAFDGSPDLTPIVPFTESGAAAKGGIDQLKTYKPRDPSTNLNGAVVEALKTLHKALDQDPKPLKFGTLVVFTDGTDRAGRVSEDDMKKALTAPENKDYDIFAIGVGAEMDNSHLEDVGRTGTVKEKDRAQTGKAFEDIATRIEGMTSRYYLLSYCSPSRAGEHEVTIEAHSEKSSGQLRYKFVANGFGPDCDPNTPPDFDLQHPVDQEAKEQAKADKEKADRDLKMEKKDSSGARREPPRLPPPPPPQQTATQPPPKPSGDVFQP